LNIDIGNQGRYDETANITIYANETIIATLAIITLRKESYETIVFTWNTTGLVKGKYTITPHATQVQNEIDTSDNCHLAGLVTITITDDVEGNFEVSILDVVRINRNLRRKTRQSRIQF
jgi:hypothetical protein